MDQAEFLIQHLTEDKSYSKISDEHSIPREKLTEWWDTGIKLRNIIKKSNQTFSNKKSNPDFEYFTKAGKRAFF